MELERIPFPKILFAKRNDADAVGACIMIIRLSTSVIEF